MSYDDAADGSGICNTVTDIGTSNLKMGFANEDAPKATFESKVGYKDKDRTSEMVSSGGPSSNCYIGQQLKELEPLLIVVKAVEGGEIRHWEEARALLDYGYMNELRKTPQECRILMTEVPHNPQGNRMRAADLTLEQMLFEAFQQRLQGLLGLYSTGNTTGALVDSGDGATHCVPCFGGFSIKNGIKQNKVAGSNVTNNVRVGLKKYHSIELYETDNPLSICDNFKRAHAFIDEVSFDNAKAKYESGDYPTKRIKLYDGSKEYECGPVLAYGPEVLVNPSGYGEKTRDGAQHVIKSTLDSLPPESRAMCADAIYTSGGTSNTKNFSVRLQKETESLLTSSVTEGIDSSGLAAQLRVRQCNHADISVWLGGSILCMLHTFERAWINRTDFAELGYQIILDKCGDV